MRLRFRFSLRMLLFAVIPLAAGLAFFVPRYRQYQAVEHIKDFGWRIQFDGPYDPQMPEHMTVIVDRNQPSLSDAPKYREAFTLNPTTLEKPWYPHEPPKNTLRRNLFHNVVSITIPANGRHADEDLRRLADLPGLQYLQFHVVASSRVARGVPWDEVPALPNLKAIGIVRAGVMYNPVTSMDHPDMDGVVSDDDVRQLVAKFPSLQDVRIAGYPLAVTHEGLQFLARLKNLQMLQLQGSRLLDDAQAAAALRRMTRLESVSFENTPVGDQTAETLAALPALKSLKFGPFTGTAAGLEALARSETLEDLYPPVSLVKNQQPSAMGIFRGFSNLKTLRFNYWPTVEDVEILAGLPNLRHVLIRNLRSDAVAASQFASILNEHGKSLTVASQLGYREFPATSERP